MLWYVVRALLSGAVNSVFLKQDAMPGFHDFSISNPGLYSVLVTLSLTLLPGAFWFLYVLLAKLQVQS